MVGFHVQVNTQAGFYGQARHQAVLYDQTGLEVGLCDQVGHWLCFTLGQGHFPDPPVGWGQGVFQLYSAVE